MRMNRTLAVLGISLFTLAIASVRAEVGADTLPGDNRLVLFRYDANNTYTILTMPGVPTDIQLAPEERITGFAIGDSVQWLVEELPGHLFIKPLRADLFTAGTIVTDKRTYQLTFRSANKNGKWYQKASWVYPDLVLFKQSQERKRQETEDAERERSEQAVASPAGVDLDKLNFNYEMKGDTEFRPVQVFDDGRFTWLRVKNVQTLPALFVVTADGTQLANYVVRGEYFVVQRLFGAALLKLGKAEVRIVNLGVAKKGRERAATFSWGGNHE
jgi:type IV secretion system protein TrbG